MFFSVEGGNEFTPIDTCMDKTFGLLPGSNMKLERGGGLLNSEKKFLPHLSMPIICLSLQNSKGVLANDLYFNQHKSQNKKQNMHMKILINS